MRRQGDDEALDRDLRRFHAQSRLQNNDFGELAEPGIRLSEGYAVLRPSGVDACASNQ
jgi:hypothetical protein